MEKEREVALSVVFAWPAGRPRSDAPVLPKLNVVALCCNPSTLLPKEDGSGVQGHPQLFRSPRKGLNKNIFLMKRREKGGKIVERPGPAPRGSGCRHKLSGFMTHTCHDR